MINISNTQQPHRARVTTEKLAAGSGNRKYKSQDDVGFEALAAAIIKQAAADFLAAKLAADKIAKGQPVWNSEYIAFPSPVARMNEVKRFFHSPWYGILCDIDPDRILKRLEAGK